MACATVAGIWFDPREPAPPNDDLPANYFAQAKHISAFPSTLPSTFHATQYFAQPPPQPTRQFLTPRLATVKVNLVHDTATFTVVQYFENKSNVAGQGKYQFPLPHDASVTDFTCRVNNDKIIRAKVKEKEQARKDFDAAVRQGRVGGIVEQQTAEIFTTTLANIPAQAQMRAELSFMCFLKHRAAEDHETFTLTVPTFIASRYGQAPAGVSAHQWGDGPRYTVNIDVLATEKILSISSQTHDLYWSQGVGQRKCQTWDDFTKVSADSDVDDARCATVQLREENTTPDKDIVIDIATALPNMAGVPQAILETHPTLNNHEAVMLTLPSDMMLNSGDGDSNGEIVFLADRSGSMGDKMPSLISAMNYFVHGIPGNRLFNIWCFGSTSKSLWEQSKPLNADTMAEALAYVRQFSANMGGTAILGAVRRICEARNTQVPLDVVVLTDGQVWNASETTNYVKQETKIAEGKVRFFSLGIGRAVSHGLVEGIAKAGGGYAEIIVNANVPTWQDRVVAMLNAATTCHVVNVHVKPIWDIGDSDQQPTTPTYKQSPPKSAPVYLFTRSRLFWLFDSGENLPPLKSVALEIKKLDGTTFAKAIPVKRASTADSKIHIIAARALLGDLEAQESALFTDEASCRSQGAELGCKWSLVSKWTSLYAVEEDIPAPSSDKQVMPHTYEHDDPLLKQHVSASNNVKWIFQQFVTQRAHTMPTLSGSYKESPSGQRVNTPSGNIPASYDSGRSSPMQQGMVPINEVMLKRGTSMRAGEVPTAGPPNAWVPNAWVPTDMAPTAVASKEAKRKRRRESHNLVERRRRDKINETIQDRSKLVPMNRSEDDKVGVAREVVASGLSVVDKPDNSYGSDRSEIIPQGMVNDADWNLMFHDRAGPVISRWEESPSVPDREGVMMSIPGSESDASRAFREASLDQYPLNWLQGSKMRGPPSGPPARREAVDTVAAFASSRGESPSDLAKESRHGAIKSPDLTEASPEKLARAQSPYDEKGSDCDRVGSPFTSTRNASQDGERRRLRDCHPKRRARSRPRRKGTASSGSNDVSPAEAMAKGPARADSLDTDVDYGSSVATYGEALTVDSLAQDMMPLSTNEVVSCDTSLCCGMPSSTEAEATAYQESSHADTSCDTTSYSSQPGSSNSRPRHSPQFSSRSTSYEHSTMYKLSGDFDPLFKKLGAPPVASISSASPRAFIHDTSTTYKSPEVVAAESFVHRLLPFQTYDGKFDFQTQDNLQSTMGPSIRQLVLSVCKAGFSMEMAATIVVLALLKEQFAICRNLWLLMERKATTYLTSNASVELDKAALLELQSTREQIRAMESVLDELERIKNAAGPVINLDLAPIAN